MRSSGQRGRAGFLKTPVELSHTRAASRCTFQVRPAGKCPRPPAGFVFHSPLGRKRDFMAFARLFPLSLFRFLLFSRYLGVRESARIREAEELFFFFLSCNSAHDAHGLIALDGVTRSYFLPFYARITRRRNVRFFWWDDASRAAHPLSSRPFHLLAESGSIHFKWRVTRSVDPFPLVASPLRLTKREREREKKTANRKVWKDTTKGRVLDN